MAELYKPMLCHEAQSLDAYYDNADWVASPKYDGCRAILYVCDGEIKIFNRPGIDITDRFPDITNSMFLRHLTVSGNSVVDGEIVCHDDYGVPDFQAIQTRINRKVAVYEAAKIHPASFRPFDILESNGRVLIDLPLQERLLILDYRFGRFNAVVPHNKDIKGAALAYADWEGLVLKNIHSTYTPGKRSHNWLKYKFKKRAIVNIVGFTEGYGKREGLFGALVVQVPGSTVEHRVGTGFSDDDLKEINNLTKDNAVIHRIGSYKWIWKGSQVQCEVEYLELTSMGIMRQPSFIRLIGG